MKIINLYEAYPHTKKHTIRLEKNLYSPNSENSSLYSYPYSANSSLNCYGKLFLRNFRPEFEKKNYFFFTKKNMVTDECLTKY
ncbi:hypothetical protein BpHYR1_023316 [Brachionus plicatilis]|uniref:Uncharacterized protein n=1 Tax=Brachionus plicatilis TaxID=10195 RepID=A0A3M7RP14_BRAPC|nr:hypothetical protein BpHYR1_023316 [Brachionus plicatilis]